MDRLETLYSVIMDMTDPFEELTIEDAKKYLKKALERGYELDSDITPEEFLEAYKDCEPLDFE